MFSLVHEADSIDANASCERLDLDARASDVMVTYLAAVGLLERDDNGRLRVSPLASEHLIADAPLDLGGYFASLRERPACAELATVLRTGKPAAWASATTQPHWAQRLDDATFAARITAAMDARAANLAPELAVALADSPPGACSTSAEARAPTRGR